MKSKIVLLTIASLKAHENVSTKHVHDLVCSIEKDKVLRNPIIVAKDHMVILDGHHRVAALRILGVAKIPAIVVDYFSTDVSVRLRRRSMLQKIIKESIVLYAVKGKKFPYKTTKHELQVVNHGKEYPLDKLYLKQ